MLLAINSMSKCTILGDNTTRDCSEACNSTQLRLVQLQVSEPVTSGIIYPEGPYPLPISLFLITNYDFSYYQLPIWIFRITN